MENLDKLYRFMKAIRKKSLTEIILCLVLLLLITVNYCINVFHILPYMYQLLSVLYLTHLLPLSFVVFNIIANFLAVIYVDSSIVGQSLTMFKNPSKNYIMYCNICQFGMPPRCWHCNVCDICILTRDHHCAFSTTCIGHYNRRYFLWFLLYFSVVNFYEIILISYYAYYEVTIRFSDLTSLLLIQLIITGFKLTTEQIFLMLLVLNLAAFIMSTLLLIYHLGKVCKGLVCHEKQDNYNFGLMRNLETVFGEKWYVTWISPFIQSKLPYDGLDWQNIYQYKTN